MWWVSPSSFPSNPGAADASHKPVYLPLSATSFPGVSGESAQLDQLVPGRFAKHHLTARVYRDWGWQNDRRWNSETCMGENNDWRQKWKWCILMLRGRRTAFLGEGAGRWLALFGLACRTTWTLSQWKSKNQLVAIVCKRLRWPYLSLQLRPPRGTVQRALISPAASMQPDWLVLPTLPNSARRAYFPNCSANQTS